MITIRGIVSAQPVMMDWAKIVTHSSFCWIQLLDRNIHVANWGHLQSYIFFCCRKCWTTWRKKETLAFSRVCLDSCSLAGSMITMQNAQTNLAAHWQGKKTILNMTDHWLCAETKTHFQDCGQDWWMLYVSLIWPVSLLQHHQCPGLECIWKAK